jgi:hypothetical protein
VKVAIFGGANPQTGGTSYEDAYQLGKLLAEDGHAVIESFIAAQAGYVSPPSQALLTFAPDVHEAFLRLRSTYPSSQKPEVS